MSNKANLLKKLWILLLFSGVHLSAQNYVDLVRIGYGQTFNTDFKGTTADTEVRSLDMALTIPILLSENHVLITGTDISKARLQLFPEEAFNNLYSTTLKLGLSTTYNNRWSSTIVLLPKLASNYNRITSDDFFLGGFAIAKLQKKKNLIYRFGVYGSTEAFGFFATPIFGGYYLSPNGRFEMDLSLPISADMNYDLGRPTIGLEYFGIGRGFNIRREGQRDVYAQQGALEFAGYVQLGFWADSILLRAKIGYTSNDFEVYADDDTYALGLSAFRFGDNRTRLNPEMTGGGFFRIETLYRFHIKKNTPSVPEE